MGRRPHRFFKVFLASHSSKRLAIPPSFWKHINPYIRRRIHLRGPSGKKWSVDVVGEEGGDVVLQSGWGEFVSDHGLRTGDFLVFEHASGPKFTVLVFDPSTCEKEEVFHSFPCRAVKEEPQSDEDPLGHVAMNSRLDSRSSQRREVTEEEKARALESALSFHSKRPFGISVMQDSQVYHSYFMELPSSLVKHLPRTSKAILLRGPSRPALKVAYGYFKGRGGFSAGWGKFAGAHNLERDDVVVFELTKPSEVRVHIHRVLAEEVPFLSWE